MRHSYLREEKYKGKLAQTKSIERNRDHADETDQGDENTKIHKCDWPPDCLCSQVRKTDERDVKRKRKPQGGNETSHRSPVGREGDVELPGEFHDLAPPMVF